MSLVVWEGGGLEDELKQKIRWLNKSCTRNKMHPHNPAILIKPTHFPPSFTEKATTRPPS